MKKTKKIVSKGYTRTPQSDYVKDRCKLIRMMQLLGIVSDIKMRMDISGASGKARWALTLESKVRDEE